MTYFGRNTFHPLNSALENGTYTYFNRSRPGDFTPSWLHRLGYLKWRWEKQSASLNGKLIFLVNDILYDITGRHRIIPEKKTRFSFTFSLSNSLLVQHQILEVSVVTRVIPCSLVIVSILHLGSCLLPLEKCHAMNEERIIIITCICKADRGRS